MAVLPTGIGPVTNGYQIERSLRFNSADSAYLNRTFSTGNRATWTWSAWVKRSFLDSTATSAAFQTMFHAGVYTTIAFSADSIYFQMANGAGSAWYIQTSQVFRDPSAWYHIVAVMNTTSATASQRMRLYVNGVEVTAFSTDQRSSITQNTTAGEINNNIAHALGSNTTPARYFPGYLTEVNFIDGQALTPSSFGETDSATGVWKPKAYSSTYGTNGFYLKFADNSNTTAATLGKDSSGNSNNWTPNNFSVTAGAGNDSLVDSPTPYGTDTGVGGTVRGNYCTWNPLATTPAAPVTFSNGNLDVSFGSSLTGRTQSTIGVSSGKWYAEITVTAASGIDRIIGIVTPTTNDQPGYTADSYGYYGNGQKITNNNLTNYGASYTTNDVIGIALDLDAGTITFYKNNTSQGQAFSGLSGTYLISVSDSSNAGTCSYTANFGQRAFAYTAPSGFKALCTTNLPTPTIGATSTTQADNYFGVALYSGTGSGNSNVVSGLEFTTDLWWQKARNAANNNYLQDAVRGFGASKSLTSNSTGTEGFNGTPLTQSLSVSSTGFTVSGSDFNGNTASETYVAWCWNAGGSTVTNTSGTISAQVRANTTSGFSIVTYTGTGSNATVGHGLGVAPSMVIVRNRVDAGSIWPVWHNALAGTEYLQLQGTDAKIALASMWNSTVPTSTVFSVGTVGQAANANTKTYVAYCFAPVAGYSAFGKYTGNSSADGTFVYTGFRPRFLLFKNSTGADNWYIIDSARNTYNVCNARIFPNSSNAEDATYTIVDFLSNGFKFRSSDGSWNSSSFTYIYAAFAETPFKYALAR